MIRALLILGYLKVVASTSGKCSVKSMERVCECNERDIKGNNLCNKCKDPTKWGYACDLDCLDCGPAGCDQSGFCKDSKCKRNSRSEVPEGAPEKFNQRQECQACDRGYWGLHCENKCSDIGGSKCVSTVEGNCTRGGKCFACTEGYYGELCDLKCPGACKNCAMMDNMVIAKTAKGAKETEYLPAGACLEQCDGDFWGSKCDKACHSTCKKSQIPSCDKITGNCHKCGTRAGSKFVHQSWGHKCEKPCADGCVNTMCYMNNGHCEKGVKDGYCGLMGDKKCPEYTVGGCDRDTCLPHGCGNDRFPGFLDDGTPTCIGCSENCMASAGDDCDRQGVCTKGCKTGWYGKLCDHECSQGCDGSCDRWSGACESCKNGLTGATCAKKCYGSCVSCLQYSGRLLGGSGNGPNHCTSCSENQPTYLNESTQTCDCIDGAERREDELCYCIKPVEPHMEEYFVATPKSCRKKCLDGYKSAYADMSYICLSDKAYKSVYLAEINGQLEKGSCNENEYSIPIKDEGDQCIRQGFVDYILAE